jgi:hypothetical protein
MTAVRPMDATRWAMAQAIDDAALKLTLIAIASHYNRKTGFCETTNDALIAITRVSLATLKRRKQKLEREGWIAAEPGYDGKGRRRSTRYAIDFGRGLTSAQPEAQPGTRLAADWALPDAWRQVTLQAYDVSPQAIDTAAECFRKFWTELPDTPQARRRDWRAVWRHWCAKQFAARKREPKQTARERPAASLLGLFLGRAA